MEKAEIKSIGNYLKTIPAPAPVLSAKAETGASRGGGEEGI